MKTLKDKAEALARDAGMQFDSRYGYWVSACGKFEGEEWYAPYYWDCVMEGAGETISGSDEECPPASLFVVAGEESDAFDIKCGGCVLVREDPQGFVLVTIHASRETAEARYRQWIGE